MPDLLHLHLGLWSSFPALRWIHFDDHQPFSIHSLVVLWTNFVTWYPDHLTLQNTTLADVAGTTLYLTSSHSMIVQGGWGAVADAQFSSTPRRIKRLFWHSRHSLICSITTCSSRTFGMSGAAGLANIWTIMIGDNDVEGCECNRQQCRGPQTLWHEHVFITNSIHQFASHWVSGCWSCVTSGPLLSSSQVIMPSLIKPFLTLLFLLLAVAAPLTLILSVWMLLSCY